MWKFGQRFGEQRDVRELACHLRRAQRIVLEVICDSIMKSRQTTQRHALDRVF